MESTKGGAKKESAGRAECPSCMLRSAVGAGLSVPAVEFAFAQRFIVAPVLRDNLVRSAALRLLRTGIGEFRA
jgi:hypothetical protein